MNLPARPPSQDSAIGASGWNSGPMIASPAPDMVAAAVLALSAFGGDLDQDQAAELLPMWKRYRELSEDDRVEVLGAFEEEA